MIHALLPILLAALPAGMPRSAPGTQEATPPAPAHVGRAFLFRPDPALGRALCWSPAAASDAEVASATAAALKARVLSTGRFVEAQVAAEEDGLVSVTFVGRMPDATEAYLRQALAAGGRPELRVEAGEADLVERGTTAEAERRRLEAWRATHAGTTAAAFAAVPFEEGGPSAGLGWLDARPAQDGAAQPRLVLARERFPLWSEPHVPGRGPAIVEGAAGPFALGIPLDEPQREALSVFLGRHAARRLLHVLDEVVLAPASLTRAPDQQLVVEAGLSLDELRVAVLALSSPPLPAPLEFVGFSQRPLGSVVPRAEDRSER